MLVLLVSTAVFLLAALFVRQGRFNASTIITILTLAGWIWAALLTLALGVLQHPGSSAAVVLGVPAALALVGLGQLPALIAALLLIVLLASARYNIRNDVISRVRYRTGEMFTRGARIVVFGVILVALGLAWPALNDRLSPARIVVPPAFIEGIVLRLVPALPAPLGNSVDPRQVSAFVVNIVNQQFQTLVTQYRSVFTLMVIATVFFAWKEIVVIIAFPVVWLIGFFVALARRIGFVYISRSQATIEQLHL